MITKCFLITAVAAICVFSPFAVNAQSPFAGLENLFTTPRNYIVHYVKSSPKIDGNINDDVWKQAGWTDEFQDIEGDIKPHPFYKTRVKMLWGDSCIYIAAQLREPNVWAYQKHHDDVVFYDNDFEVFINPNNTTHQYFEIETNALNTIFDLFLSKPYRNNSGALINWNVEGLRSAIAVQGTINTPGDTDTGWTVEMAIPFRAISTGNNIQVPVEGALWRINFSRVEWDTRAVNGRYIKLTDSSGHTKPEHNWVWSAQGVIDMHFPERWGYLQFTKTTGGVKFSLPYVEQQRQYLWLVYYREQQWFSQHKQYATSLKQFGLDDKVTINNKVNNLQLEATSHQFMVIITDENDKVSHTLNEDGLMGELK